MYQLVSYNGALAEGSGDLHRSPDAIREFFQKYVDLCVCYFDVFGSQETTLFREIHDIENPFQREIVQDPILGYGRGLFLSLLRDNLPPLSRCHISWGGEMVPQNDWENAWMLSCI